MVTLRLVVLPVLLSLLAPGQTQAAEEVQWSTDLLVGDAYNFPSRTHIEHDVLGKTSLEGDYETRGLEGPLHYAWRVSRWRDDRAWELQFLHHKLYLTNPPSGIAALSISHGFNIVTFNRAFELNRWTIRVGVGPVVAHPEVRANETPYDGPYELSGAAVLVGVGRSFALSRHWSVNTEASATFGYIDVHPTGSANLELSIRNAAVHAQLGIGYRF